MKATRGASSWPRATPPAMPEMPRTRPVRARRAAAAEVEKWSRRGRVFFFFFFFFFYRRRRSMEAPEIDGISGLKKKKRTSLLSRRPTQKPSFSALRLSWSLPAPSVSPPRAADSGVKAATRGIFYFIFLFDDVR